MRNELMLVDEALVLQALTEATRVGRAVHGRCERLSACARIRRGCG